MDIVKVGDISLCESWPYVIWKIKNFNDLKIILRKDVILGYFSFSLVLQKMRHPENRFQLSLEYVTKRTENEETIPYPVAVTTYILTKLKEKYTPKCCAVSLQDGLIRYTLWILDNEYFQKRYEDFIQSNGEVWLVCSFEPISYPLQVCVPLVETEEFYAVNEISPWHSLECLSKDFQRLLETSDGDFVLKSGNYHIFVHKDILFARCKYIEENIRKHEGEISEFEASDLDAKTLEIFVKYIYCGRIPTITIAEAAKLFSFSVKYAMQDLANLCTNVLINLANETNLLDILQLADKNKHNILKARVMDCIINTKFLKSEQWLTFSKENVTLALEIYRVNVWKQFH